MKLTAPCCLVIGTSDYPLNSVNEKRVKERLFKKYKPDTVVEIWVNGKHFETLELQDIFN